ncbi:tRNA preQ1(34) S-adenosylmethionine ribosyltransferase-isomerase QueA [Patescibacteria group bacterium]|nr:MAG: tRNA preQ1(34) S-adenosylmethionine ribosyltransferase-isomerase QueA [Patescibacteria group bacterium]
METSLFDYALPKELITQFPAERRDWSRLMVVDKKSRTITHRHFYDIVHYLGAGDLVVWNNTKVFKARLRGRAMLDTRLSLRMERSGMKQSLAVTNGIASSSRVLGTPHNDSTGVILNAPPVEIFLVRPMENKGVWRVLAKPGRKLRLGMKVVFAEDFACEILLKENNGTFLAQFGDDDLVVREKANKYGEVPTPPYIGASATPEQYQTVYAKHEGSVAAPTAGFHFTPELIEQLKNKGVEFAEVTLHVGMGTFVPVKTKKVEEHKMHGEWVELSAKNADLINAAKREGRRVVAVGTTTVRALEGIAASGAVRPYTGDVNLFITPGFKFQIIDALITNFHLPQSTLLMLVSAFIADCHPELVSGSPVASRQAIKFTLDCYKKAIEAKYRFYSFGDAMLLK